MSALGYGLGDYTLNGGPIRADRRVAHQTPSYLPPRLSSPLRILPSPSRSTVVPHATPRRICALVDRSVWRLKMDCLADCLTTASRVRYGKECAHTPGPPGCGLEPKATRPGWSNNKILPNGVTDHTIPSAYSWVQVTTLRQPLAMASGIIPSTGVLSVLTDLLPIRPLPISL